MRNTISDVPKRKAVDRLLSYIENLVNNCTESGLMKQIEKILGSNAYLQRLDRLCSKIIKYSKENNNEATIRSYIEGELCILFSDLFDYEPNFKDEQTNRDLYIATFKGRIDAISNDLVIEYKKPSTFTDAKENIVKKGIQQLVNYLEQLKDTGITYDGIITDGVEYVKIYYSDGKFNDSNMRTLDVSGLDFMIRSILNVNKKHFSPNNLKNDFGKQSVLTKLQKNLYKQLQKTNNPKVNMLFQEWMSMYHLSLNDDGKSNTLKDRRNSLSKAVDQVLETNVDEYHALFALETGYAIIVKIFALKILPKIDLNNNVEFFSELKQRSPNELRNDFESIENGYVFNVNKINNLLEQDFFSWYTDKDIWNTSISSPIEQLIGIVDDYADASLTYKFESTDLFKEIYMLTIPSDVRKAFGEFFTPGWLADNVISEAINLCENKNWNFLDPTCGSGTFLLRAIDKIVIEDQQASKSNNEILDDILNRVRGIDLNPLSVLSARVSYLLALRPFISKTTPEFEIPVYLGDSAKLPHIFERNNIKYVQYSISTQKKNIEDIKAILPYDFVLSSDFLPTVKNWQTLIKSEQVDILSKNIESVFPEKDKYIGKQIENLSKILIKLYKENWDGIWLRIISNFMLPVRIKNVDIIAGNPPWVKWENLPKEYAREIKHIAGDINLFSGKNYGLGGGINLNLAALISNVVGDHWLNKTGVLAFLMPDTFLNSDSYEGWRKFEISNHKNMFLVQVTDWSNAGHPFTPVTDKFLTYFLSKKNFHREPKLEAYYKNFPKGISISDLNIHNTWSEVAKYFKLKKGKLMQLSKSSTRYSRLYNVTEQLEEKFKLLYGKNEYKARQGVELTPREVFIFTKNPDGKYSHIESSGAKIKAKPFSHGDLETEIMRPLLQSSNIGSFNINQSDLKYGLIPYNSKMQLYSENELNEYFPKAFDYLLNQKEIIEQQSERSKAMARGNKFYALSKLGPYSNFNYGVAFRDNSTMKACFVDNTKEVKYFPVKHAPYISRDQNGKPISKNEALYLTGILNLPIINKYFKSTYSERSYSINFDICIPKFVNNSYQEKMVKITTHLLKKPNDKDCLEQLEDCYLDMLKNVEKL